MKNFKIGIVRHGFVGRAVGYGFSVNVDKTINFARSSKAM
jgi:hypothetical protein